MEAVLNSISGDPCGIRTRDLHLERVASWAARRTGRSIQRGGAEGAGRRSGVYAIGLSDHEAHRAGVIVDTADLVVDHTRGGACHDQLALIDIGRAHV